MNVAEGSTVSLSTELAEAIAAAMAPLTRSEQASGLRGLFAQLLSHDRLSGACALYEVAERLSRPNREVVGVPTDLPFIIRSCTTWTRAVPLWVGDFVVAQIEQDEAHISRAGRGDWSRALRAWGDELAERGHDVRRLRIAIERFASTSEWALPG
jgi:hypothetical protein